MSRLKCINSVINDNSGISFEDLSCVKTVIDYPIRDKESIDVAKESRIDELTEMLEFTCGVECSVRKVVQELMNAGALDVTINK